MGTEEDLKGKPENAESWREAEPDVPTWEEFVTSDKAQAMAGTDEKFEYLTIDMEVPDETYISSVDFVELEDKV